MVVKVKNGTGSGTVAQKFASMQKQYGESVGNFGGNPYEVERVPTGLFPLDLAMGGGFPRGVITTIWGNESSGKTNAAFLAIANNQKMRPKEKCVFVAFEPPSMPWASKLGVNTDELLVIQPTTAEQGVDIVESLIAADDVGVIVVDSLAAMLTGQELESNADKQIVGGGSVVIKKLMRKASLALQEAGKLGRDPCVICINQVTTKIGVMYGDPSIMPGGKGPLFFSGLIIRLHGKSIVDSKVNAVLPVRKEINFKITKYKVPITAESGKVELVVHPHDGFKIGEADDWSVIKAYMTSLGMLKKNDKKGWDILGVTYPTQDAFQAWMYEDAKNARKVRHTIISAVLKDQDQVIAPQPDTEQADDDGVLPDKVPA